MCKLTVSLLFAFHFGSFLFGENFATPAMRPYSMRGIIFPSADEFIDCFVDEDKTIKGVCKSLSECTTVLDRWKYENIRPQTCYFNKFDHVVCCEIERSPLQLLPFENTDPADVKRRSETACEDNNPIRVAVVLGEPTAPNEFPFMAALGWKSNFDDSFYYKCGGALISKTFVLTAAHCAELGGSSPIVVRTGGVNLTDPAGTDILIKSITVHPAYNISSSYHDIALLELEEESTVNPACIWITHHVDHNNVTALGYGHTRFGGAPSDQLLKAKLFVVPNDVCQTFYGPESQSLEKGIATTQICAGDPEHLRDTCQGDSGGPLVIKVKRDMTLPYIVGVTSFGQACAGEPPSIYTRISSYVDWIEDIVWPIQGITIKK